MKNINKLSVVSLAVAAALPMMASADVIITEYIEGGSYRKAIEIYNTGDATVDLSGYTLARYADGKGVKDDNNELALTGEIAAKAVQIFANSRQDFALPEGVTITAESSKVNFNGGDAVALLRDGVIVDVVGPIDDSSWGKDKTYRRFDTALTAKNIFVPSEWKQFPKDSSDGLGAIGVDGAPVPVLDCTDATFTSIHDIQGAGATSPLIAAGEDYSEDEFFVKGIVTTRSDRTDGFFIQTTEVDGDDKTSEGIFVYTGYKKDAPADVVPGKQVCVKGKIKENYGMTQVVAAEVGVGYTSAELAEIPAATPFKVNEGETYTEAMERVEGMKIKLDASSDMVVASPYGYNGKFNSMTLAHKSPLFKPTQLFMADSAEAAELVKANMARRLELDTDLNAGNGEIAYMPDFNVENGFMRVGDTLQNIEGVAGFAYGTQRLYVTNTITGADFTREIERADIETPAIATKGDLRVGSFNVLNYFTSHSEVGGALNVSCSDQADADASRGCNRGAKSLEDFELQRTKIVKTLIAMNADVVGLMEMENNGFGDGSGIKDLVDTMNKDIADTKEQYAFIAVGDDAATKKDGIDLNFVGTDAIMVALIYKPAKVTPSGALKVIKTPEQHAAAGVSTRGEGGDAETSPSYNKYQRHSIAQTFMAGEEKLTVVVNHLKSKGSGCLEDWKEFAESDDPADLQGHCNEFRVSAAEAIGNELKKVDGDILILGDMNAYGMEDPLLVLTDYHPSTHNGKVIYAASHTTLDGETLDVEPRVVTESFGYINLNTKLHGTDTYSYKWAGELGNLDHALANPSMASKVTEIQDWHINSNESTLFEYAKKYTGDLAKSDSVFSSSDHDPIVMAIEFEKAPEPKPEPVPASDDSGSLGFLGLAFLSAFGLRRRRS